MNLAHSSPPPRGANLTTFAATPDPGAVPDEEAPASIPSPVVPGWDAFEVWRTRVRDARRDVVPRRAG